MLPRRRKIAIAVSVALAVPVVAFVATWSFWLPGIVRERAEAVASARLGMQCVIGDVSLRTRGAVLEDVVLTGRHGGLRVEIAEIGVKASVWDLLEDGASAIERVQAREVDAELNLTEAGARESLRAVVNALSTAGPAGTPAVAAPGRMSRSGWSTRKASSSARAPRRS
jgi:hypothetical protein